MPLFGSSREQDDARKQLSQIPQIILQHAQTGWTREDEAWLKANNLSDVYVRQLMQQADEGIGSPEDARATGERVMPGVNDLIDRRAGRISGQQSDYSALPDAQSTIDERGKIQDLKDSGIGAAYGDTQGAIDLGFGSQKKRTQDTADQVATDTNLTFQDEANKTSNALNDQIKYTGAGFDQIAGNADKGFGAIKNTASGQITAARDRAASGFGAIGQRAGETYSGVRSRINQGRDFETGTTARAFAPAMAATTRRLRNAGIDANSPEAAALMQKVDSARGHAFDDTATRALENLNAADLAELANKQGLDLSKMSNDQILALRDSANQQDLDLSKMSNKQTLDLSKLSNEQTLALQNAANRQGLSLQSYLQRVEQAGKTRELMNSLDAGNMKANIGNADLAFERGQAASGERMQNELINRGIRLDDFGNRVTLSDKANANDMTAFDLKNAEFNAGANYTAQDLARRDRATALLGNAANQQFGVANDLGNEASRNAGGAESGFQASYDREAPNSNIFGKFTAGLVTAAVPALVGGIPGFGTPKKTGFAGNQTGPR